MEYRYPLLDIRLVEFYLAIPPELKGKNGFGRYIFRKASEHLLSDDIIWRTTKDASSNPHIEERANKDTQVGLEMINALDSNHPYHQYGDRSKIKGIRTDKSEGKKRVRPQVTTIHNHLLLARKLEDQPMTS